ncbi:peptidoglycan deacetylase [Geobacter sp. OR-1]|nr:peptidoglycan deacetylase [Geobacter sp. OR-1]
MNKIPIADAPVFNAITVDVEEWFHVCGVDGIEPLSCARRVRGNVERLLAVLDAGKLKATFFVLGSLAADEPGVVAEIAARGHEIASHGYSHSLVGSLDPAAFRDELRRTADILEHLTGRRPEGFRAPQWSLSHARMPWAFDILIEEGYRYDSSCNPLPFVGDRAGSRTPWRIRRDRGDIWEIPPLVTPSLLGNLPTGGGWGFRFFPFRMIENTVCSLNSGGAPAVFFLHPRELDPAGPRLPMSRFREFVVYGPRKDAMERLSRLLSRFRFITLGEMVANWGSA